jgi:hypothetical protein
VGTRVARLTQIVGVAAVGAQQLQPLARLLGEFGGKAVVVGWHRDGSSPARSGSHKLVGAGTVYDRRERFATVVRNFPGTTGWPSPPVLVCRKKTGARPTDG